MAIETTVPVPVPASQSEAASPPSTEALPVASQEPSKGKAGKDKAGKGKGGKGKGSGKKKGGKRAGAKPPQGGSGAANVTIAGHPRAARSVARAKALGGLAGFMLGGYLSLPTHTLPDTAVRALIAGIFCYVAVWGAAVFLWRRLVVAELRQAQHELLSAELRRLGVPERPTEPGGARAHPG